MMRKVIVAVCAVMLMASLAFAETVKLPDPDKSGTMPLTEALALRRTTREFSGDDFSAQELANLLWAAGGVNRPDGRRVHPVAMGLQDTTVYVFKSDGVYRYDAPSNSLELVADGDHRQDTGRQDFVGKAAVNLAYVHNMSLWENSRAPKDLIKNWGFAHTGAMMQNVYLYAAAMGWNCVVRGMFDADSLGKLMKLSPSQSITLIQTVGKRP